MKKYLIHHQSVCDCPECGEVVVEDLGECDFADDDEVRCPACGAEFILSNEG